MRNFQDLVIWQKSHQITLKIYSITRNFPKEEAFGYISEDIHIELSQMVIEVRKMIYSFILSLGK